MEIQNEKAKSGQYLTFQLKNQTYGFSIAKVQEINRMMDITPVPKTARSLVGVINLRGKVIPVVDLSLQLNMGSAEISKNTCIIVTETENGPIGVVVDFVNSVMEISEKQIEVLPVVNQSEKTNFIIGLAKIDEQVVVLMDILAVLAKENLVNSLEYETPSGEEALKCQ